MTSLKPTEKRKSLASRTVREVYPVSRLVREARQLLEGSFPLLWVEGEISNLAMPASGHIYFTLKDEAAQVRCAMFRNRNMHLRFTPENGMQVLLRVRVTLYEGRGEFQLVVEHMEEAGSGALQRAYEALKQRLGQEGLFDEAHKKTIPLLPQTIGIISSPDGAAVHDILSVLKRRFAGVNVILYPVPVQGEGAARQITQALQLADQRQECDVLIISRGGGSLEDLWSFNDEQLARAIFASETPIISAVGHEIDFTIADFVADVRAPTPSAVAELAVADANQMQQKMIAMSQRLTLFMRQKIGAERRHLQHLHKRLPKPSLQLSQQQLQLQRLKQQLTRNWLWQVQQRQQRLDYLLARIKHPRARIEVQNEKLQQLLLRLNRSIKTQQHNQQQRQQSLLQRLQRQLPSAGIKRSQQQLQQLNAMLQRAIQHTLLSHKNQLAQQMRTLSAVSPLSTLERGYSITTNEGGDKVITDSQSVEVGQSVQVRLHHGKLLCEVKDIPNE